ncbi:DUF1120 domain-containing protein [Pseudomonas orientalis]|uniref:Pilin (Type 1 fimbria component protein) n=1 Tax=Pseudomonas orientalis TaxID=76758 RepID=A0A1H2HM23_9PSED|nr:DUF1120 domain-containing protein [Pseudomonas orientalis]KRP64255.1 hypothetical protein TU82_18305 [Pseudomonas orientalis]SDU32618.1 Pilin (type 1 fimbria component protein) [Pseudomonas orientalis]
MSTTSLSLLSSALFLALTSSAFAASSVDLAVKGSIVPSACTPALSEGGVVDYGKIAAKDLNVDTETSLPTKALQFSVSCDAATLVAVRTMDNRTGSSSGVLDSEKFGLGLINNGTEKLGYMGVRFLNSSLIVDDAPAGSLSSRKKEGPWMSSRYWAHEIYLTPTVPGGTTPIPAKLWTAEARIYTKIAPTSELSLSGEVPIDGSITVEVVYL